MTMLATSTLAPSTRLRLVKLVHDRLGGALALCTVAIPVLAWRREFTWAFAMIAAAARQGSPDP